MALDFFTGFDHYATADLTTGVVPRFTSVVNPVVTSSAARYGAQGLRLTTSQTASKTGLSNAATRILGAGFRFSSVTTGTGRGWLVLSDGDPTNPANGQVGLMLDSSGHIEARRGVGVGSTTAGTLLGTSTNVLSSNTWYFIELVVTVDNAAGTVEVFVNGTKTGWIHLSSQDTQATANAYANAFGLGNMTGVNMDVDDLYCISGTGGTRTTRLGDVKCTAVVASAGDGSVAQFTPSSGSDNGAMVDEATPDGDTTYNESATPNFIDTYNFAAVGVSAAAAIYGLQVHNVVKKTDAGACNAQGVARIASTNHVGTSQAIPQTYGFITDVFEVSPASASNWTPSEVDAAEFGIKHL